MFTFGRPVPSLAQCPPGACTYLMLQALPNNPTRASGGKRVALDTSSTTMFLNAIQAHLPHLRSLGRGHTPGLSLSP